MVSESRSIRYGVDQIARNEIPSGMNRQVSAKADIAHGKAVIEITNGTDAPLSMKEDYEDVTVITSSNERYSFDLKGGFLSNPQIIAPKSSVKVTLPLGDFKGTKEDVKRLVCSFDLGATKVVLMPAHGAIVPSLDARVSAAKQTPSEPDERQTTLFQIHEVTFTGNKEISSKDLQQVAAPFLNKDVNFIILQDLVTEIKKHYRAKGYAAAYVYLLPQSVSAGKLQIEIMEGLLENIEVEGNKHVSTGTIKKYFADMKPGAPLKYEVLQGDLSRLNKNTDIKAKAVLKPGSEKGTTDVRLKVEDKQPHHVSVDANNLGTPATGQYRLGTTYTNTNLFGNTDVLALRGQAGSDAGAFSVDYSAPIQSTKSRLGGTYTHAYNQIGSGDFKELGIQGDVDVFGAYLLRPIVAEPNFEANGKIGFDWKSSENRILGFVSGKDEVRILYAGFDFEKKDAYGTTFSPHSFNLGLDALGATMDAKPASESTDSGFFVYRGSVMRSQVLARHFTLFVRGTTQLTPDALPMVEQMPLGGAYSVRGYSQSAFLADNGVTASAELRVAAFPEKWSLPVTREPLNKAVELVFFVDGGRAKNIDQFVGERQTATLAGAGAGFRIHLFDKIYARCEWATPISGADSSQGEGVSSYFGISAELI